MEIKLMALLFLEIAMVMINIRALANDSVSLQKSLKVSSHNTLKNKYAVKSIQSEDGDIIDCVDIYKQPAFSHPALKNHKIQLRPSYVPIKDKTPRANATKTSKQIKGDNVPDAVTTQLWQRSGSCPKTTVPIRRMPRKKNAYEARQPSFFHPSPSKKYNTSRNNDINLLQKNHSLSVLHTEGFAYLGAKGDIYVWNPRVDLDDDYTTSQVALKSGPHNNFETVEAGWALNPRLYKDRQTRFFVYWTADGSRKTGCFDQFCPGFVQINKDIALGAAIHPISKPYDLAKPLIIYIFKDPKTNNWWVNYGEETNIGYWPAELFRLIRHHAETVQWGGEVYSSKVGTHPHTATAMGNGEFSFPGPDSGVIKRIRILENSLVLKFPEFTQSFSDEYDCYDYFLYHDVPDPEFYYGGPGQNWRCS